MARRNKLEQAFGPVGSTAGIIIFVAGLVLSFFSLSCLILLVTGAFVGFTFTGTLIDFEKKRIRFSNYIFGIIAAGKWVDIKPGMYIGITKPNQVWRSYSLSNRSLDIAERGYRLVLYTSEGKEIMQIQKSKNIETAKTERDSLCAQLGTGVA